MRTIEIAFYPENLCGEKFDIGVIEGYTLNEAQLIYDSIEENYDEYSEYIGYSVVFNFTYVEAQIGNYPPPNVEAPAYWYPEIVSKQKLEESND